MKKYIKLLVPTILAIILILPFNNVQAKTLGELKKAYETTLNKYNETKNNIKLTEEQISSAKSRIDSIYTEMAQAEKDIQNTTNEITKLNNQIAEKEKQMKELMKFFQVSSGESTYLEYIFSADSITDFIYRVSVTEQLSKYNNNLIDEMHKMIDKNNKNIESLHKKEDSLKSLQSELTEKVTELSKSKDALGEESLSYEEELKAQKSILDYYTKSGCKDNEDVSSCGSAQLPAGTKFWRPLSSGCITENYGYRICPFHGKEIHSGMDMACGNHKIYAVSDGKVKYTGYSRGGYGNYIVIHHNINGRKYSSLYGHLAAIYVKQGDIVNKDTVIGLMGSTGASTGTHLHLNIYNGWYLQAGESASLTDPRNYINFPTYNGGAYARFADRTTYYN